MIERISISVSLTPELHAFASDLVESGNYGSISEVVRAGLRALKEGRASLREQRHPVMDTLARGDD